MRETITGRNPVYESLRAKRRDVFRLQVAEGVQERGRLMIEPGDAIYVGMIVGENARENDIPVNPCKAKKLTNMRSQGDGKGIQLSPPLKLSLERALEYIGPDEYVEATPKNLRLRKKILNEVQRKRAEQVRVNKIVAE